MDHALSTWIDQLAKGDDAAAQVLWSRYFDTLIKLARKKLRGVNLRVADEEDVALSAMNSFLRGARAGKFPRLADQNDLWKLLVTITARKAVAHQRRHFAQKRGAGLVRGESALQRTDDDSEAAGVARILGSEPTPEMAAQFAEDVDQMLGMLDEASLREIAMLNLEGYSTGEIAERLGRNRRTVERKMRLIQRAWESRLVVESGNG